MNLKQSLLATALICLSASAYAETYVLWPGDDSATQIPYDFNGWWNISQDYSDGVWKCWPTTAESNAASCGWIIYDTWDFDFSLIAPLDLTFDAKVEGAGQWNIRLTAADGVESDVTLSVPADGQYHKVRINVKDNYPAVYQKWISGGANGKTVFPLGLSGTNLDGNSAIYLANCRYVDAVALPAVTATASDITFNSARINIDATFPEGYTATKVTVNGEPVEGSEFIATGLTPGTKYDYTIVAEGNFGGETLSSSTTVSFRTAYDKSTLVWYGTTDKDGFFADYSIAYDLSQKTLTVSAEIITEKETPVADRNFHIYIGGNEWLKLFDDGTGILTGTTTSTFEEGDVITWEWYLPYAGGVYQETNQYTVGAENEAPLAIRISAATENISFDSAEISYTVTAPDANYKVFYRLNDGEAVEASSSPIVLSGLAEKTEYTCEVYAVYTTADSQITTHPVELSFKTTAKDAVDLIYSDLYGAEFKNAFRNGEDESMRRSIFVTLPWEVIYRTDGTATYSVDLSAVENIVGLVPQIYWNGFQTLTKNAATGRFEYSFGAQELEAETAISHYFAYAGGVVDVRTPYTHWGMEKEAPVIGAATSLTLSASAQVARIGDKINLSVVARDENGNYLPSDNITYTEENANDLFDGDTVTMTGQKGERTIVATSGDLRAWVTILVIASADAKNVAEGLTGYTDDYVKAGTVANVTDADRNSQLEWACDETHEHYFILDLGEGADGSGYYIEGLDVYFEGAYATAFTVTLSTEAPAEIDIVSPNVSTTRTVRRAPAASDVVFTNEKNDTQHYFTQEPESAHRYVALRTSQALNTDWGIKLRDLKVYATEQAPIPTGVASVATDSSDADAPVEFFDLNGRRIANPSIGLYIRRQGSTVSKVYIK